MYVAETRRFSFFFLFFSCCCNPGWLDSGWIRLLRLSGGFEIVDAHLRIRSMQSLGSARMTPSGSGDAVADPGVWTGSAQGAISGNWNRETKRPKTRRERIKTKESESNESWPGCDTYAM